MQIEEGAKYVTRSGEVVGPMVPAQFGRWRGWDGGRLMFELDGRHGDEDDAENHFIPNEPANDIVAVVSELPAATPAPGYAGHGGAHTPGLVAALRPLAAIADAYDANELDDEARKFWGVECQHENNTPPDRIELYAGRGGRRLLTLADCFAARAAIAKADGR